jgi:starch-binding outer membrane protein, SusD/RagB family
MKKTILIVSSLFLLCPIMRGQFPTDTISQSLQRAYTQLANQDMYSINYWAFGECRSDNSESGGSGTTDVIPLQNIMIHEVDSTNFYIKEFWYRGYTIISFCNYVIQETPGSGLTSGAKNLYLAEAKFLRALIYFNLVNTFDSVPIYTETFYWPLDGLKDFNTSNKLSKSTNTMAEVYDQIKTDLTSAIGHLPNRSLLDHDNRFRATSGAAMALLAKAYLFESSFAKNYPDDERFSNMEQKWDSALYYAEEVINSGEYQLIGNAGQTYNTWWDSSYLFPGNTPAFRYIFTVDGNGSDEIVFPAINLTLGQGWTSYGGNGIVQWTTVKRVFSQSGISTDFGWGWNVPSQSLINAFASESGNAANDPRFKVTVGQAEDSVYAKINNVVGWYAMDLSAISGITTACRKYECSPEEFWNGSSWADSPFDIPVIRFSDVILMAAEAALELGDNAEALSYINMVRTRARLSGNTGHPLDLTNVTLQDIKKERQLELALEGHRFYDLVRWGDATDVLNGRFIASHGVNAIFEEGIDEFFPTPEGAIGTYSSVAYTAGINCSLYPNPAKDYLMIQSDLAGAHAMIFDVQGRKVMEATLDDKTTQLDIKKLAEGYYTVQILNQGNLSAMKFVKE